MLRNLFYINLNQEPSPKVAVDKDISDNWLIPLLYNLPLFQCKYPVDIKTSVLVVGGRPELITLDYCIGGTDDGDDTSRR